MSSLVCNYVYGQISLLKDGASPYDSTTTFLFELNAERSDISTALNRAFLGKIAFGGYISSDITESVQEKLSNDNYYRGFMNPGVSLSYFSDSSKYGFIFSYRYTNIIDLEFKDDIFNLIFDGNSKFADRSANLSKSMSKYQAFQSLSFGLVNKKTGSFLSLGIYDGIDYRNYRIGQTSLSTSYEEIDGEKIPGDVMLATKFTQFTESSRSYSPFGNGAGVGLSAAYNFEAANHKFQVSVSDLGFMYWRDLATRDTSGTFNFEGFRWKPSDGGRFSNIVESLIDSINPSPSTENKWLILPGYVKIEYFAPAKKRIFITARGLHYYGKDYYSELSGDINVKYGKRNFLWVSAGVGDYSKYILGLGTEFSFYEQGVFRIGTRQIMGIVDPEMPAANIYFKYSHRL